LSGTASTNNRLANFGLLFGAATWGVIWYPYRILQEAGISGLTSSFYTYVIAAFIGFILFARHWHGIFKLPQAFFWLAAVAGWTNFSYVLAVLDGEVMRVMLLFYLSPLWTLLLAHFWLKDDIGLKGVLVIVISLTGAFTMFWQAGAWPVPHNQAEWLGLSAGVSFALTNAITHRSKHLTLQSKSMAVWLGVIVVSVLVMPLQGAAFVWPAALSLANGLLLLLIALMLMAATMFVQYGVTRIPVTRASVIFLFELVVAAIASYYLASEAMELNEWIGGLLIVAAAMIAVRQDET